MLGNNIDRVVLTPSEYGRLQDAQDALDRMRSENSVLIESRNMIHMDRYLEQQVYPATRFITCTRDEALQRAEDVNEILIADLKECRELLKGERARSDKYYDKYVGQRGWTLFYGITSVICIGILAGILIVRNL